MFPTVGPLMPAVLRNTMHTQQGQSIIEILIALTLVILFLSGITVIQLFSIRNVQFSRNKSTATKLAAQQLERVRVVRDSAGIDALSLCNASCFINSQLTPVPQGPPDPFVQTVSMRTAAATECPVPSIISGVAPVLYKVTSKVTWSGPNPTGTPAVSVIVDSCITD